MYRFVFSIILSSTLALGCGFESPTVDDPGGTPEPDAGPDPGPCTEAVRIAVTVNGQALADGGTEPLFDVLPGDSIELSAQGSCVSEGDITYDWTIESMDGILDLAATADPSLQSETLSVYPERAQTYRVILNVNNGNGDDETLNAIAFEVPSWTPRNAFPQPGNGQAEFRDVSVGNGFLWVAAKEGAFRLPLADPINGTIEVVNDVLDTGGSNEPLPNDTKATFYEAGRDFAWFSDNGPDTNIYRGNFTSNPPVGQENNVSAPDSGQIRDIAALNPNGIVVASQVGVYSSPGSSLFEPLTDPADLLDAHAVATRGDEIWVGTDDASGLHKFPGPEPFDVFPGVNDNIRQILVAGNQLWLASSAEGIARVDPTDPAVKEIFDMASGDLPDDAVRFLAEDTNGDIWAATADGIARYKADRDLWLTFNMDGLEDYTDAHAIMIDERDDKRTIIIGAKGMAIIQAPVQPAQ